MRWALGLTMSLFLWSAPLQAQVSGVFDMGMIGMDAALSHVQQHEEARAARAASPSAAIARSLEAQLSRQTPAAPTVSSAPYQSSAATQERIADIMAQAAERQTPGTGQEMRELMSEALLEFQRIGPVLGFRTNDAIDALAFYLLAQWGVANDHRADITRTQVAGVRRQAASAYSGIADQIRTDAQRQGFAQALIVQGIIMSGIHEAAVRDGNSAAIERYASMARTGGHSLFAMDPTRIALTDQGFRQK